MFKENFLHFIWRLQYFYKRDLVTVNGEPLVILKPGTYNTDAGPDFSNARIKIGTIEWVGNIEIHTRSSDWRAHHHQKDPLYTNIILHVVYTDDEPVKREDGSLIPTLELKSRIEEKMILKYSSVVNNTFTIPCQTHLESVSSITKASMLGKAILERLESKSDLVIGLLNKNKGDWQETNYQWLSTNFGFKTNSEPFLRLAKAIPFKLLLKHRNNQFQMEALLFGQAGFLEEDDVDDYHTALQKEYRFLSHKYAMYDLKLSKQEWKFLRTRPANFPTLRIAQLAAIIVACSDLIVELTSFASMQEIHAKLNGTKVSEYWTKHYKFGEPTEIVSRSVLGKDSINSILINTVAVLFFAMGREKSNEDWKEKALEILDKIPGESNKITREWKLIGLSCETAYESQAVLQLNNHYCANKRCLECEIGATILKEEMSEYRLT